MPDTLQSILIDAGLAIAPFRAIKTPEQAVAFFQQLGYTLPSGAFGSGLNALAAQAGGLVATIEKLASASSDADVASAVVSLFPNWSTRFIPSNSFIPSCRRMLRGHRISPTCRAV